MTGSAGFRVDPGTLLCKQWEGSRMPAKRTVFFGRVNRRYQPTLIAAPFREEMERLVELGRFTADDGQKHWIVGDLEIN